MYVRSRLRISSLYNRDVCESYHDDRPVDLHRRDWVVMPAALADGGGPVER